MKWCNPAKLFPFDLAPLNIMPCVACYYRVQWFCARLQLLALYSILSDFLILFLAPMSTLVAFFSFKYLLGSVNNSLLISMCILRDLPQQKNLRALCRGSSPNFICSHVPMEILGNRKEPRK